MGRLRSSASPIIEGIISYKGGINLFDRERDDLDNRWAMDLRRYIPHEHIIGISKLTRLVRLFAKRFAVQERLGEQIVTSFNAMLQPHGLAVYLEAHHLCVEMRGVRDTSPLTRTTLWRGEYERNASLRVEFLPACGTDL